MKIEANKYEFATIRDSFERKIEAISFKEKTRQIIWEKFETVEM
jgi:hypothetical protein